jgi:hypothetical protein
MTQILARGGLLICALVIVFLARRLHKKAHGSAEKAQKILATIAAFLGGLALLGTFVGEWMGRIAGASPYLAAAGFLLAAGGLLIEWWADGKPDKFAFWCALALPLATVIGFSQLQNLGNEMGRNAEQVSTTISNSTK